MKYGGGSLKVLVCADLNRPQYLSTGESGCPIHPAAHIAEDRLIELGERVNSTTRREDGKLNDVPTLRKLQLHKAALELLDQLPVPTTEDENRKYAYYVFGAKDYPRAIKLLVHFQNQQTRISIILLSLQSEAET